MNKGIFLLCLLLNFHSLLQASSPKGKQESKIVVDTKIGINYVTHIYTLAKLGFEDVEYERKYERFLSKGDHAILEKHRYQLEFSKGQNGVFSFFFFLPARNDFKTKEDFLRFGKDFRQFIEKRSCSLMYK